MSERHINISAEELWKMMQIPAIYEIVKSTENQIYLEEDESSSQVRLCQNGLTWLKYRLRDRRFDGPDWKPTALIDWNYGRESDKFPERAIEESIYCLDPRYPLTMKFSEAEAKFIKNPFEALPFDNPTRRRLSAWLSRWQSLTAREDCPPPGFFALRNVEGFRTHIFHATNELARSRGYEYVSAVPTWWHIAEMLRAKYGFSFVNPNDEATIATLKRHLVSATNHIGAAAGLSWVVMLMFWAELSEANGLPVSSFGLPEKLFLREAGKIVTFPLNLEHNLWMVHKL